MFILFMIVGLIFLVAGAFGLFHVNINVETFSNLWVYGNITFGVFTAIGIAILVFMAIFNTEFD